MIWISLHESHQLTQSFVSPFVPEMTHSQHHPQRSPCQIAFSLPGRRLGAATNSLEDSASGSTTSTTLALAHPVSEGQTLRGIRTRILGPAESDSAGRSGTELRSMVVEPVFDSTSRATQAAQAGGWDWTTSPIGETIDTSSLRQASGARHAAELFPSASSGESPPPSYAQALEESSERLEAWFNRARSLYGAEPTQPEDPLERLSHLYRSMLAFTPQERHDGRLKARTHGLERAWETMEMGAVLSHLASGSGWQGLGEDDMENLRGEVDRTRWARMEPETEQELSSASARDSGKVAAFLGETVSAIASIGSSAVLPTAAILVGLLAAEHRRSARDDSLVTLANSILAISDIVAVWRAAMPGSL
ncbi:hypothetical protein EHS25_006795 [Saitozyma podzolica]|uniref:Uncharacterized protein n=1 Tax=Saitozyma podzolica TaxID=1890683 RepID=A0A427XRF9_9TREE|nr:hypothetical protein EHS25_006795 [Saitozyma podzolica]